MNTIKALFDPNKDIHRTIEKVITYDASQELRLKSEISEYVATESIEEQFEKLLSRMQAAMEEGGENILFFPAKKLQSFFPFFLHKKVCAHPLHKLTD